MDCVAGFDHYLFRFGTKIAQPVKEGVKVYKSDTRQLYEEAMLTVGTSDRLQVLDSKRDMHKIKTSDGTIGWVEKRMSLFSLAKAKLSFSTMPKLWDIWITQHLCTLSIPMIQMPTLSAWTDHSKTHSVKISIRKLSNARLNSH